MPRPARPPVRALPSRPPTRRGPWRPWRASGAAWEPARRCRSMRPRACVLAGVAAASVAVSAVLRAAGVRRGRGASADAAAGAAASAAGAASAFLRRVRGVGGASAPLASAVDAPWTAVVSSASAERLVFLAMKWMAGESGSAAGMWPAGGTGARGGRRGRVPTKRRERRRQTAGGGCLRRARRPIFGAVRATQTAERSVRTLQQPGRRPSAAPHCSIGERPRPWSRAAPRSVGSGAASLRRRPRYTVPVPSPTVPASLRCGESRTRRDAGRTDAVRRRVRAADARRRARARGRAARPAPPRLGLVGRADGGGRAGRSWPRTASTRSTCRATAARPSPPRLPDGQAWGVPEYAALVAHYIRENGLAPVPVIGHSNGGRIALTMASDAAMAGLVSKMVLVSPSGVTPPRSAGYYLRQRLRLGPQGPVPARPGRPAARARAWRGCGRRSTGGSSPRATTRRAADAMRETFVKTVNHLVDDRLGRIRVPTLDRLGRRRHGRRRAQMDDARARASRMRACSCSPARATTATSTPTARMPPP